ncbi:hypothetical protein D3C80_421880 [compost metagenome]
MSRILARSGVTAAADGTACPATVGYVVVAGHVSTCPCTGGCVTAAADGMAREVPAGNVVVTGHVTAGIRPRGGVSGANSIVTGGIPQAGVFAAGNGIAPTPADTRVVAACYRGSGHATESGVVVPCDTEASIKPHARVARTCAVNART